jgi:ribosomal protein S18 acetylase RimI-like enzyme
MEIVYKNRAPVKDHFFDLFESTGWYEKYQLDADQLYQALQHSWHSVSAYDGDRLVGFGRAISDGTLHALIAEMIVLPSYQGRGIGNRILKELVARCQSNGVRDIQLFCAKGKVGFYEKHGFVKRPDDAPGMGIPYVHQA